ncbi:MAG: PIG-L family deacetylase [Nitrospirae bacterium]|nr:PIG-L family deacetylase [Nitrospirota bacterium]
MRVKWAHIYRYYEFLEPYLKISLPLEEQPEGERILVLAPHIDDETIGCGGTIYRHTQAGNHVTALFISDCSEERRKEGDAAGRLLGMERNIYWDYRSKTIDRYPEITGRLTEVIEKIKPGIVYLPSFIDRHNDHVSLNRYFYLSLQNLKKNFMIYSYEVWTTLIPNVVVDISDQAEVKKKAMACYQSQMANHNWLEGTLALNRYRGMIAGARTHGEAFFRLTPRNYVKLWSNLYG